MSLFVFFILLLFSVHSLRSLFVVCWLFFAFVAIALPFAKCYGTLLLLQPLLMPLPMTRSLSVCVCALFFHFSSFSASFCALFFAVLLSIFMHSLYLYLYLYLCRAFYLTSIQYARIEAFIHRLYTIYIHKTPCNSINSFSFILQLRFDSLFLCIFPRTFTFQIEAYHNNRCQWLIISSETFLSCFAVYVLGCMGVQYAHICVRFTFSHSIYLSFSLPYCLCSYTFIIQHNTVQHSTCWCLLISLK